MISITRLVIAAAAVFTLATVCPAQENVKATNLGKGRSSRARRSR